MRMHRVGTFTLGVGLILFGLIFAVRIFSDIITYQMIFKFWPVLFILLGGEILAVNFKQKEGSILYDGVSIFLIIVLSFFAMGMSVMEYIIEKGSLYF